MATTVAELNDFSFLTKTIDDELLRASAQNILDSYAHPWDILAETLQNSVDAIDLKAEKVKDFQKLIFIDFDSKRRAVEITDTGVGISANDLKRILAPGNSLKRGIVNLRGEKGVGISFVVFACNRFRIETCDGKETTSLEIEGANSWIKGSKKSPPIFQKARIEKPQIYRDSHSYTRIWVEEIPVRETEEDLFAYTRPRLLHVLRTKTAIGHTFPLFNDGKRPSVNIRVELSFTGDTGVKSSAEPLDYSYASPAEYLKKSDVVTWDRYQELLLSGIRKECSWKVFSQDRNSHIRYGQRNQMVCVCFFTINL